MADYKHNNGEFEVAVEEFDGKWQWEVFVKGDVRHDGPVRRGIAGSGEKALGAGRIAGCEEIDRRAAIDRR